MKILLTNDDGYFAEGIQTLYNHLKKSHDVVVVAPDRVRSSTGHALSLKKPIRIKKIDNNIYSCSGFPADCVLYGLEDLFPCGIDLVISGINDISNLGQDIFYSGTVAAAREAFFRGVPSLAMSLATDLSVQKKHHYESGVLFLDYFLKTNLKEILNKETYFNINIPNYSYDEILGHEYCELGFLNYLLKLRVEELSPNEKLCWVGGPLGETKHNHNSDFNAIANKKISVTPLKYFNQVADKEDK